MIDFRSAELLQAAAPWRARLLDAELPRRLAARDASLWPAGQAAAGERLGWLTAPAASRQELAGWRSLLARATAEGIDRVLVLGMGGSALAADMFRRAGSPERLRVVDSTHPRVVARALGAIADGRSLVLVASKSGTTVETRRLADLARTVLAEAGLAPTARFVSLSDEGTPLTRLARNEGWRAVLTTPADVGGRFSAFTAFGLLPALAAGIDVEGLLTGAEEAARACADPSGSPALDLAAVLACLAAERRPLRLVDDLDGARSAWAEQLLAESLGKDGLGLWPLPPAAAGGQTAPRLGLGAEGDIMLRCADAAELGHALMSLMWATAAAGAVLGLQPFDQPDVEAAKRFAAAAERGAAGSDLPVPGTVDDDALAGWWDALHRSPPATLVLATFIDPDGPAAAAVPDVCRRLAARLERPVVPALGPRYLHATGQLHKGGPADIAVLVLLDDGARGPTAGLLRAQALGDVMALRAAGRPALAVALGATPAEALGRLAERFAS